jgi:hypothetical protein
MPPKRPSTRASTDSDSTAQNDPSDDEDFEPEESNGEEDEKRTVLAQEPDQLVFATWKACDDVMEAYFEETKQVRMS